MKLLGKRNWYFPSWLAWLPDVQVEDAGRAAGAPPPPGRDPRFGADGSS